ncbi:MAG: hypothetical protein HOM34_00440 [Planctomycetes bacterium]|jgi:hypothetical protein|nr:hypothetical protein [Planctomycetota bacterium]MBT4029530.1 hypothetical protein [Planctomycetota bacterium]MBT4560600.1 hypothetical protein [Planctomycetota bacterium]MBT5101840.1 hypothetical protein [Planctomycetota bacterium]MBT5119172.1 hypothetical protein [Planctomycetota bacterium]
MTTLLGQLALLVVFSFALSAVVSAYRDDEKSVILKGMLRRALMFMGTIFAFAVVGWAIGNTLLRP